MPSSNTRPTVSGASSSSHPKPYDSQRRIKDYATLNQPAHDKVREVAAKALYDKLDHCESKDRVWLRKYPRDEGRLRKNEINYFWMTVGDLNEEQEEAWMMTIGREPHTTISRWSRKNLEVLHQMIFDGIAQPFLSFRRFGNTVLGLGFGIVGVSGREVTHEEYEECGMEILRDITQ
ncbi:hypothetical protein ABW20_dc0105196 [Dactylellina cionopaga]|nr:hypothetical protein ABW20_dc0105196 [Dactylellina cionopaga]